MIETPRLVLRRFIDDDRAAFAEMNADPEVREFFPGTLSRAECDAMIDRINDGIDRNGYSFWCAALRSTNRCIGFIGVTAPNFEADFTPCIEIGWRLARDTWGQGLATEGARASLAFAFDKLGLADVVAFTVPDNRRSRAVMERIGMRYERDFLHPKVAPGHRLERHVLYRITREQFYATAT